MLLGNNNTLANKGNVVNFASTTSDNVIDFTARLEAKRLAAERLAIAEAANEKKERKKDKNKTRQEYKVAAPIVDQEFKPEKSNEPVEAIYSLDDIETIKDYLLNKQTGRGNNNIRNYTYFVLSINLARRAGDIVGLRVGDVLNPDGTFREHIIFNEQKSGRKAVVYMNTMVLEALTMYFNRLDVYKMSDWLFPKLSNSAEHMTVDGMRKVLQRAIKDLGLDIHIGTHSLRKTMSWHIVENSENIADEVMVSQLLNHKNIKTTYHYIGRSQKQMDEFIEKHGL